MNIFKKLYIQYKCWKSPSYKGIHYGGMIVDGIQAGLSSKEMLAKEQMLESNKIINDITDRAFGLMYEEEEQECE